MNYTRREIIQSAASAIALSCVNLSAWPQAIPVRTSIARFSTDRNRVAQFRRLFSEMRQKKASDPASYFFQGAVHWFPNLSNAAVAQRPDLRVLADMFNADPDARQMLGYWNQCTHQGVKTPADFLLWHRAYLYYFEQHARKTLADPSFAVPYWDYGATNVSRQMPSIFLNENVAGQKNPLYPIGGLRRNLSSPADALDLNDVRTVNVMSNNYYFSESGIEGMGDSIGLGIAMNDVPHGLVHGGIGGWMGDVPTAAFDPVFWLHHTNIDRLFNLWQARQRYWSRRMEQPEVDAWLSATPYQFYNADGQLESKPRAFFLDQRNLGYVYDTDPAVILLPTLPVQSMAQTFAANKSSGIAKQEQGLAEVSVASLAQGVTISAANGVSWQLPVSLPQAARDRSGDAGPLFRTILVLADVKKIGELGGNYGVFVGPNAENARDSSSPAFVRRFSSFDAPEESFPGIGATYRFDITRQVVDLSEQENLTIRIVPMPKSSEVGFVDKPGVLIVGTIQVQFLMDATEPLKP